MNDLEVVIKLAEADVQERQAQLDSAEARVAVVQADAAAAAEKLAQARTALEWMRQRSQDQPTAAADVSLPDQADQHQPRPRVLFGKVVEGPVKLDQIFDALETLGGTATNKQISSRLLKDGIEISPSQVRGLLKYASGKKPHPRVTTEHGSGVWRLVPTMSGAAGGGQ